MKLLTLFFFSLWQKRQFWCDYSSIHKMSPNFFAQKLFNFQVRRLEFRRIDLNSSEICATVITGFENQPAKGIVIVNQTVDCKLDVLKELVSFEKLVLRLFFQKCLRQQLITFKKARDKKDTQYLDVMFETKIDSCRVAKGVMSSFFMKMAMENFKNNSNFEYQWEILTQFVS